MKQIVKIEGMHCQMCSSRVCCVFGAREDVESVEVDLELEPVTPPDVLYHGTAEKYLDSILREGLKPRKRCYVHLSETRAMALEVGSRHGTPVVLVVDSVAMAQCGVRFYKAHRGVWLVDGVSPEYINIDSSEY